jgi:hypothetical protein
MTEPKQTYTVLCSSGFISSKERGAKEKEKKERKYENTSGIWKIESVTNF